MISKVPRFAPDVVVLDLEDAIAAVDKEDARAVAVSALAELDPGLGTTVLVRVNPVSTPWFAADVAAVADSPASGLEVLYARSQVSLAAHLAGVVALDQAVVRLDDDAHFTADADAGAAMGYQGKICIHPRQVGLCHEVFTPTDAEVVHARTTLAAGAAGVAVVDGAMIDEVHLRMARAVLGRAGEVP